MNVAIEVGTIKKIAAWTVASGTLALLARWLLRMFVSATDIDCGYNWSYDGDMNTPVNMRPNFDIRNRSSSRTYRLANIKYELRGNIHWFDNRSIMGRELKPGSIEFINGGIAALPRVSSLQECLDMRITLRTQDNKEFVAHGPGQQQSKLDHRMTQLRLWLNKHSVKMD